jgi:hypothetical protein
VTSSDFWAVVDKAGPVPAHRSDLGACWVWTGGRSSTGYGRVRFESRSLYAHRVSFYFDRGRWPLRLVCHHCDNRTCVRPDHLFEGTHKENFDDMVEKGRRVNNPHRGELSGVHRLTTEQVLQIRSLAVTESRSSLAARFGVSRRTIRRVALGTGWTHMGGSLARLPREAHGRDSVTAELEAAILAAPTESTRQLAMRLGLGRGAVGRIRAKHGVLSQRQARLRARGATP